MSVRPVRYFDRRSGQFRDEPVYAGRLLFWAYDTHSGRAFGQFLLRAPWFSKCYAWLNKRRFSRWRIVSFARAMGVNLAECRQPLGAYQSFNEFFIREIDLNNRPIAADAGVCAAPADGRMLVLPVVDAEHTFCIKGGIFKLRDFLADAQLSARFSGGAMAILRLHLADYHHFHFPVSGVPAPPRRIPGCLHAVGPYARRWPVPFFSENRRALTLVTTQRFGVLGMCEIGACTVGSIRQSFVPGLPVCKGDHKGRFELGGSTVVLLFEPGVMEFDADLRAHSADGTETYVRMGERIGACMERVP